MALYARHAPGLAATAAERALESCAVAPHEIDHLVIVSCTGFVAPGPDVALVERLGLRRDVERTIVGFMGCHGALNGLRAARAYAEDPEARVLLCAVVHSPWGRQTQTPKVASSTQLAEHTLL